VSLFFRGTCKKLRKLSSLVKSTGGRSGAGLVTTRHRGGRQYRRFVHMNAFRDGLLRPGLLVGVAHQGRGLPLAGLVKNQKGALSYLSLPQGVIPG